MCGAPRNPADHGDPDAASLAAAHAYGLARNHGFADGNKRTAWVIARLFLAENGHRLRFDKPEAVRIMQSVAAGTLGEDDLADWFRRHLVP
ncbi:MAG TPA: type II toxin-antitoxin system death-on-curing family toxin [Arenibaculum sp.]|nr:type II toxin-antitoxin system death-on-curing family toxin [Arenibaculum sp.]